MNPYAEIAAEIAELVGKKQQAYGDSFGRSGDIMRVLYPSGISLMQMADALTIVRVIDKLFRIATSRDALDESPWRDIMGYALLAERRAQGDAPRPSVSTDNGDSTACS
jgi:hypothetical protein